MLLYYILCYYMLLYVIICYYMGYIILYHIILCYIILHMYGCRNPTNITFAGEAPCSTVLSGAMSHLPAGGAGSTGHWERRGQYQGAL